MSEFPSLAEVLAKHRFIATTATCRVGHCACRDYSGRINGHPAHQAEAWREACTITTVEQLKACPRGTIVMTADDRPLRRWPADDEADYWTAGDVTLPALLIWHPEWATS